MTDIATHDTAAMTAALKELRAPFPDAIVGKLPKKNNKTGRTTMVSYVGHAAVTDRLLRVDPYWTWEPLALGDDGLPAHDRGGNLWIKLTICGVTRLGVGDGSTEKERIGDAIRNAAMRFGVALDLWAREDLWKFAEQADEYRADQDAPAAQPDHGSPAAPSIVWGPLREAITRTGITQQGVLDLASGMVKRGLDTLAELDQQQVNELTTLVNQTVQDVDGASFPAEASAA